MCGYVCVCVCVCGYVCVVVCVCVVMHMYEGQGVDMDWWCKVYSYVVSCH